jgi:hypothetical protein
VDEESINIPNQTSSDLTFALLYPVSDQSCLGSNIDGSQIRDMIGSNAGFGVRQVVLDWIPSLQGQVSLG